jgi:hypothetical protein
MAMMQWLWEPWGLTGGGCRLARNPDVHGVSLVENREVGIVLYSEPIKICPVRVIQRRHLLLSLGAAPPPPFQLHHSTSTSSTRRFGLLRWRWRIR